MLKPARAPGLSFFTPSFHPTNALLRQNFGRPKFWRNILIHINSHRKTAQISLRPHSRHVLHNIPVSLLYSSKRFIFSGDAGGFSGTLSNYGIFGGCPAFIPEGDAVLK